MNLNPFVAALALLLTVVPIAASAQQSPTTLTAAEHWINEETTGLTEIRVSLLDRYGEFGTWNAVLAEDTVVNGIPCVAGQQVRIEYGNLESCTLSAAWTYAGVDVPAGSIVELYANEPDVIVFSVQPGRALHIGDAVVESGETAVFHRSDRDLQYIIVAANIGALAGPASCHGSHPADTVLLHADRTTARCHLAEPYVTSNGTVPVSSVVAFNEFGELVQITLHAEMDYGGEIYPSGSTVENLGEGERVSSRSSYIVPEGTDVSGPFWRVSDGFYYGYPIREVFPVE